ncbi:PH domain-containing protein [Galbitalea sp. SE-J8]|uniref:PH domain-containing protein n=1 Tax=Galbitalea sp. SE-J8 TaxID=3054952 RepID=UPI00259C9516|nr:PH domain-containing protein [Galbitalea sp. SE-J8]MDM4762734.1 PH domain-containing protein [Galbitalea sp. SE-J8]
MSTAEERMPERAPETVVAQLRPHARRLVLPAVVLVAVSGAVGYLSGIVEEGWQQLALIGGAALVVVLLALAPFLVWLGTRYTITSRRVVVRTGGVVRVRQELLHSRGYDVTVRQSAGQAIAGSGTVEINAGLDRPVVLRDVPNARLVQEALNDLMEESVNPVAARRQRSQARAPDETVHWGSR